MLTGVHRKLQVIRYHSAARPRTVWTRAFDLAMVGSLLAALPVTWLSDALVVQSSTWVETSGYLSQLERGAIVATLFDSKESAPENAKPIGNFQLRVDQTTRGWPLTTSNRTMPARLDLDIMSEPGPRKNADLDPDDPLRLGIEAALTTQNKSELLEALQRDRPLVFQHWLSWTASAAMWWIVLAFTSSAFLWIAKYSAQIWQGRVAARRKNLRAQGKCLACGYDMTGLEFNEKCPECGELVW